MHTATTSPTLRLLAMALPASLASCSSTVVPPGPRCVVHDARSRVAADSVDFFDLLFVVSDSPSMAEEQAQLAAELPALVQALITGELEGSIDTHLLPAPPPARRRAMRCNRSSTTSTVCARCAPATS